MLIKMESAGGGGVQAYNNYFANNADIPASIDFGFVPQVIYLRYKRTSGGTNDYVATVDLSINTTKKAVIYGNNGWTSNPSASLDNFNTGAPEISISGTTLTVAASDLYNMHIIAVPSAN